jgi:carboxyl-terminal processing protease
MKPFLLAVLIPVAVLAQAPPAKRPVRRPTTAEDLLLFSQVLNQIRVNHPDSIDPHELYMAAIEGMVHAADPHSFVLAVTRLAPSADSAWRSGRTYPVPIEFSFTGGAPVVLSVAPGTAAARLDILPGDELIAVDSQPVIAESDEELQIGLAGRRGSTVALTLERRRLDGSLARLVRAVTREKVEETSAVPAAFMLDREVGYVRVTTFLNDKVDDDLHAALGRLEKSGMKRLVLDLRDNGGGSVAQAAAVAGEFLPRGALIYTTEYRKRPEGAPDTVRVGRSFWSHEKRYPLVVLINSGTASASELVAGALQDNDRAVIVGQPSFGKALLMNGMPLTDGSMLMLVVGHVRTPCGRVIQREYHGISRHEYYRLARAERDTVGRPSCHTLSGRTVFGGGGIYPDASLPEPDPPPLWLARVAEDELPLKWVGGYISAAGTTLPSLDSLVARPALPAAAVTQFRGFAAADGVEIPADADNRLQRALVRFVAYAKWGDEGYYRMVAVTDPEVQAAQRQFDRAATILSGLKDPP